ncbi:LytTR family transcriptional regulator DNA-binding domain-containing protein [Paenibacillus donghaensis]|uniref:HTH LytTR-type domain-containing protein n=1 Tax=Paenibacillus donghaensis TaxID=414771 RepID=A0A2Z2KFR0_9BACL|nr:LytTR family transcriptional regulator DNA-binding domain-containing protein [Paenibacillus donghaensis]ASA20979.1 hypothetical protein B9T62_09380 [Paenibacillus donghaensis]
MMISVAKDMEGFTGLTHIDVNRVAFLECDSRLGKVMFNTVDNEVYYSEGTLKYWTQALNGSGYNFYIADRSTSVNIENITEMNEFLKVAYFEINKSKTSNYCTMSKSGYKEVTSLIIDKQIDVSFT